MAPTNSLSDEWRKFHRLLEYSLESLVDLKHKDRESLCLQNSNWCKAKPGTHNSGQYNSVLNVYMFADNLTVKESHFHSFGYKSLLLASCTADILQCHAAFLSLPPLFTLHLISTLLFTNKGACRNMCVSPRGQLCQSCRRACPETQSFLCNGRFWSNQSITRGFILLLKTQS